MNRFPNSDLTDAGTDRRRRRAGAFIAPTLDPKIVSDIESWRDHPQLSIAWSNLHNAGNEQAYIDSLAEILAARRLIQCGCELRVEVPTPLGKTCDFEVMLEGKKFYLHVKRLNTSRPFRRKLSISSRLRLLESIARPYLVEVRLKEGLRDPQMQHFVTAAAKFIEISHVGDELVVRDERDEEIGGCRIMAPAPDGVKHVCLSIGLPTGFIDESKRIHRLLRKAYRQFMPREENVILVGLPQPEDAKDFETALFGSHEERWDTHPPRGRRIAHGRAEDGLWQRRKYHESHVAGWFIVNPNAAQFQSKLWFRPGTGMDEGVMELLCEVLDTSKNTPR